MDEYKKVVAPIEEIGQYFNELQRKKQKKELTKKIVTNILMIILTPCLFLGLLFIGLGSKNEK